MYSCKNIAMRFFLKILLSLLSEISICAEKVGFPRSGHIYVNLSKMLRLVQHTKVFKLHNYTAVQTITLLFWLANTFKN